MALSALTSGQIVIAGNGKECIGLGGRTTRIFAPFSAWMDGEIKTARRKILQPKHE
jgi:hypothetical protein